MEIRHLEWREHNLEKLLAHGISRQEVEAMVRQDNYIVDRHREYPHQVRITGYTSRGRWLTIAMADLGAGAFRPVTGWVATAREREDFMEKTQ